MHLRHIQTPRFPSHDCFADQRILPWPELHDALGTTGPTVQDRLYWFLFKDMRRTSGSDIPRFTKDDEAILAKEHFSDQVTESTTFGDVYRNRLQTALVPLEEHVFQRWYFRRTICIGDAAHKVFLQPPLSTSLGS